MISAILFMFLIAGSLVSSVHCAPAKRTVSQILEDLATVSTQAAAFDNAAIALPSTGPATLSQLLTVHTTITTLTSGIQHTTTDVNATPGPVSEADAQAILLVVNSISATIIHAVRTIKGKRDAFGGIPNGVALMKQDLNALRTAIVGFFNALIEIIPHDITQATTEEASQVDAALQEAIAIFS